MAVTGREHIQRMTIMTQIVNKDVHDYHDYDGGHPEKHAAGSITRPQDSSTVRHLPARFWANLRTLDVAPFADILDKATQLILSELEGAAIDLTYPRIFDGEGCLTAEGRRFLDAALDAVVVVDYQGRWSTRQNLLDELAAVFDRKAFDYLAESHK